MQTVALARGGRLAGLQFWISKKAVEITRIGEDGVPMRQEQMLTMLDADIDMGALLDGADQMAPALDVASQAVALLEGTNATMPATSAPPASSLADIATMPLASEIASTVAQVSTAEPIPFEVDPDDRESVLADLAARLAMAKGQDKMDLLIFARIEYGQGWTRRPKDVDSMIGRMKVALADPMAFREQVRARVREASASV